MSADYRTAHFKGYAHDGWVHVVSTGEGEPGVVDLEGQVLAEWCEIWRQHCEQERPENWLDEHLPELLARYAAEDGCDVMTWTQGAVRSVVRQRYEGEEAARKAREWLDQEMGRAHAPTAAALPGVTPLANALRQSLQVHADRRGQAADSGGPADDGGTRLRF